MAERFTSFINAFPGAKEKPAGSGQWLTRCPAHDDRRASLSIKDDTAASDRILIHCQAGCSTERVLAAAGKTFADILPGKVEHGPAKPWQRNLVAEYRYIDADGSYLYSKLRYEGEGIDGKEIRYGRIIDGKYKAGKGESKSILYNIQDVHRAIQAGRRIYIVEGEKDVETLRKYRITATTAGAVTDWKSSFADELKGASEVVIIADRDEPGQKLAQKISKDLKAVVYSHKIITPSGFNHGDVTDYLTDEDGTIEDLLAMVEHAESIAASWLIVGKGRPSVNVDLLASEILRRNELFIARNPGTKSDIAFWYSDGKYHQMSEAEIGSIVRSWLPVGKASPDTINKVIRMILYSAPVRPYEDNNSDESIINCSNGLVNINTGQLLPHTPEHISSLQLNANFIPGTTAPRWTSFIESLCYDPETETTDDEMRDVLQEWTGITLSSIYGYRLKKALILFSALGNSGKSVYLSVISGILGNDAVSNVDFKSLGTSRWATGRAFGRRCLAIGDEGGSRIESSAIFKQLTGGDIVSAEFKGLQAFDYRYRGVIIALCNVLPYFDDDKGNHVADRLMLLNCRHTIPWDERDPMLADKLMTERDGILQWAWAGLKRFIDNGYHFSPCQSSDDLMKEYRARHDNMYAFLLDEMEITGDRHDVIRKTDLEYMYSRYCQERELAELGKKNIALRLASLGVPCKVRDGYSVYVGVKRKDFVEVNSDQYIDF